MEYGMELNNIRGESTFCLGDQDGRLRVRRRLGERPNVQIAIERQGHRNLFAIVLGFSKRPSCATLDFLKVS